MIDKLNLPLVSVVIATYNGERFIREQLDSVLLQSYPNLEIIIVDDCSSDNTRTILDDYAEKYPQIKLFKNESNLGYQKNFEKGFLLATGDYVAPCDQDDIWLPTKIEVLLKNSNDYAIVYCDSAFIDKNGLSLGRKMSDIKGLTDFDDPIMFALGGSVAGHAMLIKRQLILDTLPFPDELMPHDYWLGFVATFNSKIKFINEVLVLYRRHDKNIFGAIDKKNKQRETASQRVKNARQRVFLLYQKCPDYLPDSKQAYLQLHQCYEDYSFSNNMARMCFFFKHQKKVLAFKKRNEFRRHLFCLKTFFKIL